MIQACLPQVTQSDPNTPPNILQTTARFDTKSNTKEANQGRQQVVPPNTDVHVPTESLSFSIGAVVSSVKGGLSGVI